MKIRQPPFPEKPARQAPTAVPYQLEKRLAGIAGLRCLKKGTIDRLCSLPIKTSVWGIAQIFPGREEVQLFAALEKYVGSIAGDRFFSRRMDAVSHTIWLLEALQRIADAKNRPAAGQLYAGRGQEDLAPSAESIVKISQLYHSLPAQDKKILWLGALLHDIGKATGNREKHPLTGLTLYKQTPAIAAEIRRTLASNLTDHEIETGLTLIEAAIGQHDIIGGLAITKDRSIFDCVAAIKSSTNDPTLQRKLIIILALINFADIDGQSERGIYTARKITAFAETVEALIGQLEAAGPPNYAWWGKARVINWCQADTPNVSETAVGAMLEKRLSPVEKRELFEIFGKLELADCMYNVSTTLGDPAETLRFLIWLAGMIKRERLDSVLLAVGLFTSPAVTSRILAADNYESAFTIEIIATEEKRVLRLSP